MLRTLCIQVVRDTQCHLPALVQLFDDLIVVGIVLETSAGIDDTGDAEPV